MPCIDGGRALIGIFGAEIGAKAQCISVLVTRLRGPQFRAVRERLDVGSRDVRRCPAAAAARCSPEP